MGSGREMRVKVTRDGPYVVTGGVPLSGMVIEVDEDGYPLRWRTVEAYPGRGTYALCRCGKTGTPPFCDGSHVGAGFEGEETAGYEEFMDNVKVFEGPELTLRDNKPLCAGSAFCTRAGNIWNLTTHSDDPGYREVAVLEAADCPSGRLVLWDKEGRLIEPEFELSIAVTVDEDGIPGPIWVRGGIPVESEEGVTYEVRNRVTLCRCGRSENKPFCDTSHLDEEN